MLKTHFELFRIIWNAYPMIIPVTIYESWRKTSCSVHTGGRKRSLQVHIWFLSIWKILSFKLFLQLLLIIPQWQNQNVLVSNQLLFHFLDPKLQRIPVLAHMLSRFRLLEPVGNRNKIKNVHPISSSVRKINNDQPIDAYWLVFGFYHTGAKLNK